MHLIEHVDIIFRQRVKGGPAGGAAGGINADNFCDGCTSDQTIGVSEPAQGFLLSPTVLIFGRKRNLLKIFIRLDILRIDSGLMKFFLTIIHGIVIIILQLRLQTPPLQGFQFVRRQGFDRRVPKFFFTIHGFADYRGSLFSLLNTIKAFCII